MRLAKVSAQGANAMTLLEVRDHETSNRGTAFLGKGALRYPQQMFAYFRNAVQRHPPPPPDSFVYNLFCGAGLPVPHTSTLPRFRPLQEVQPILCILV